MSYYTLTAPGVVGQRHYIRIPAQPIEVDDKTAADLVASGLLVPYPAPVTEPAPAPVADDEPPASPPAKRRRPHS